MKGLAFPKRQQRPKVATTKKLDALFREFVRKRDGWKCKVCRSTQHLQLSHYWSRRFHSVRWDPENCDLFCAKHHMAWEHLKAADYRSWKLNQLGFEHYDALQLRMKELRPSSVVRAEVQAWLA